ncbi:MAG TPA: MarR family transcriptional regulator [Polyangiaceae bacterium]|nr:MarR family transcriptional regulator [Polyangiaceae bacterium]
MPSRTEPLTLEQHLCFALYRASRAMIRGYAPLLEPLGLTYAQYLVLVVLWEEDAVSVRQLGERLSLDSATLTPLLKRLEAQGAIERRRDPDDERVLRVRLTKAGRALQAECRDIPMRAACQLGDFGDRALLTRIARLREELSEIADQLENSG